MSFPSWRVGQAVSLALSHMDLDQFLYQIVVVFVNLILLIRTMKFEVHLFMEPFQFDKLIEFIFPVPAFVHAELLPEANFHLHDFLDSLLMFLDHQLFVKPTQQVSFVH